MTDQISNNVQIISFKFIALSKILTLLRFNKFNNVIKSVTRGTRTFLFEYKLFKFKTT